MVSAIAAGVVLLSTSLSTFAIDGLAVAISSRQGNVPEALISQLNNCGPIRGALCKYTIRNNLVTQCDTLVKRSDGFAQYPAFSLDAQHVAFYHWGARLQGSSLVNQSDTNNCIAVINADGTGLLDLVRLEGMPGIEISLDWPAGDWIYYIQPKRVLGSYCFEAQRDICRVNYRTKVNEFVCTPNNGSTPDSARMFIRRFTLSLDATRTGLQIDNFYNPDGSYWNVNGNFCFPLPNGNLNSPGCNKGNCPGSCNASLSCSGCYSAGYLYGAHEEVFMAKLAQSNCTGPATPSSQPTLAKATAYLGKSPGSGAECIRWAANSDKWLTETVGWNGHADAIYSGSNSLAINWVNNQYIMVTNNPKATGAWYCGCSGDLWVVGGPANSYEDPSGQWHVVATSETGNGDRPACPDHSPVFLFFRGSRELMVSGSTAGPVRGEIIDMKGKIVKTFSGKGSFAVSAGKLMPGPYVAHICVDNRQLTKAIAFGL
jgi:hypothetical protein